MVATFKGRKWDEERDGAGEFAIPDVPDGTYKAEIVEVTDREFPGFDGGPTQLKYMVDWRLLELEQEDGKPVQLRQFVTVPQGLIDNGYIHPKAQLFSFLKAVGEDPEADDIEIDPMQWIGRKATIWVKNEATKKRPNEPRPQVKDATPLQAVRTGRPATTAVRKPVAATAGADDF